MIDCAGDSAMTTTIRGSERSLSDFDVAVENAKRVYEERLLPKYKDTHRGCHIVVDGISEDYEIGDRGHDESVVEKLLERRPDAVIWSIPIGKSGFMAGSVSAEDVDDIEEAIGEFHRLRSVS